MHSLDHKLKAALALNWQPSFDGDLDYQTPQIPIKARAAVMVLIEAHDPNFNAPSIVLTKRTDALRHHSGQVAFPGGRIDAGETSWQAALRETQEEIGLPKDHPLDFMGELSHHFTITGFDVTPIVAVNRTPFSYVPEPGEVEAIFEIPLSSLKPENFEIGAQDWKGQKRHYFVLPHADYFIWGATARMLHQLAARLHHVQ